MGILDDALHAFRDTFGAVEAGAKGVNKALHYLAEPHHSVLSPGAAKALGTGVGIVGGILGDPAAMEGAEGEAAAEEEEEAPADEAKPKEKVKAEDRAKAAAKKVVGTKTGRGAIGGLVGNEAVGASRPKAKKPKATTTSTDPGTTSTEIENPAYAEALASIGQDLTSDLAPLQSLLSGTESLGGAQSTAQAALGSVGGSGGAQSLLQTDQAAYQSSGIGNALSQAMASYGSAFGTLTTQMSGAIGNLAQAEGVEIAGAPYDPYTQALLQHFGGGEWYQVPESQYSQLPAWLQQAFSNAGWISPSSTTEGTTAGTSTVPATSSTVGGASGTTSGSQPSVSSTTQSGVPTDPYP